MCLILTRPELVRILYFCFRFLFRCVFRTSESLAVEFKYVLIKLHVLSAVLLASLYVFNSPRRVLNQESVHDLFFLISQKALIYFLVNQQMTITGIIFIVLIKFMKTNFKTTLKIVVL